MQTEIKRLHKTQIFIKPHSNQLYTLIGAHGKMAVGLLHSVLADGIAKVTDQVQMYNPTPGTKEVPVGECKSYRQT